jgi:excisionase family DNA binding protein
MTIKAKSSEPRLENFEILTRREAAQFARLSVQSIDLLIARHKLTALRVGRRILIKKSELLRTLEAHTI